MSIDNLDTKTVDSISESPRILTHTLQRITLVNWYLFRAEDIEINGRSVLITGRNGAGKSTILDAIQTIIAGADENKLSYNAISNDGAKVTRSLKSYCLGEVGENHGGNENVATRSRVLSNTYLSLSWNDRNGKSYSFGCYFYAKKESRRVEKHFFIIKNYDLSSVDFMEDEFNVITWKQFERRLSTLDGEAIICNNATEFRNRCCECMSAVGSSKAISTETLFRTIKKGLQFRQQKSVTEFIRDYILPEKEIDVIGIENDYKQYVNILEEIQNARDRLNRYQVIIKLLENQHMFSRKALNYDWVCAEIEVSEYDLRIEQLKEDIKASNVSYQQLIKDKEIVTLEIPNANKEKENSLIKINNSNITEKLENIENTIKLEKIELENLTYPINKLKEHSIRVETIRLKSIDDHALRNDLNSCLNQLKKEINFENDNLLGCWPRDKKNLKSTLSAIENFSFPQKNIQKLFKTLSKYHENIDKELTDLTTVCKKLEIGDASLQRSTDKIIELLAKNNIKAIPICDLAEVTNEEWQWGIERFLGVWNREALIIVDDNGELVSSNVYDKALSIYRKEKEHDKRLRAVKLLNPEKISAPHKDISPNTAASLINSKNETALHYLQGLLLNVQLVETEEELRRTHRAITKDGMVSGNGAISGGNRIDFVLLGKNARMEQVNQFIYRITYLNNEKNTLKDKIAGIQKIKDVISKAIEFVSNNSLTIISNHAETIRVFDNINRHQTTHDKLSANTEYKELEIALEKSEIRLKELYSRSEKLAKEIGATEENIKQSNEKIISLENNLRESLSKRKKIESNPLYDSQLAQNQYKEIESSSSEIPVNLIPTAKNKSISLRKKSDNAKLEANKQLVLLCERHDIDGKNELINLSPFDQLVKCRANASIIEESEIVLYEQDAKSCQESMLSHFRSSVVSKLQDNFNQLSATIRELNEALNGLHFNNFQFRFTHKLVETTALHSVYEYATNINHLNSDNGLFDEGRDHEGIEVIEKAITENRLSEIADYRNFFSYDIAAKDIKSQITRTYSELLGTGSEGEKQSPFYVALAASFVNAYRLKKYTGNGTAGGAALALFDEAMSKMDGANTSAALRFFNSLGLQIIMAAPPETAVKVGTNIPVTMRVTRSGGTVYIDETEMTPKAKQLLESDDPRIHPEISKPFEDAVREEFGVED